MSKRDIKKEFALVIRNAKITAFIFFILLTPNIVIQVKGLEEVLGLPKETWFNAGIAGFVIYLAYMYFLWKCPSCGQYPGRGWFRKNCEKCGVELS
ncbi:MAG: hypothetical protein U5K55_15385 [Aliarcobacter sp.]|jgi:hypothetical protein|nr:hypothetical protein [Aliarcobacter sp.]